MINLHIKKELFGANKNMLLDLTLQIQDKTFLALCGQSGSGKTTFLRCLAGLEKSVGLIKVDDEIWQDEKIFLPPQKRRIGFVFQDYALFENLTIEQNLLFVQKDKTLCQRLLDMLDIANLKDRYPNKLSGGQKQRVALGRAMMRKPKILLLDEPLSALDPNLRAKLQDEILKIHNEFKTTTILVSHDPSEIYKLANEMIELKDGKITRQGSPEKLLLKTQGSQKFSFSGSILNIEKIDSIFVVTVSIGQQITQIVVDEALDLKVADEVSVSTKAFNLNLTKG
ncbi:molybdenum ABC transporter ModABC, ATP-binding protein [Campylobacter blaseri]|uniref:Molybdenum ABC transporter ATP-binding protein n=1 Tax=Campylobacter blaseri TaxID=2042961 RepID=A0A2P8R1D8_9BACT|nr:ATP-binding cassette domain-containing protein [Campylobacter blaseri]PSM52298.1 molybdenum ABC transporter ATP-binding protein [Campylobacter blaseri]PSM54064.1 molybdenum ABC transporter ATP-binding protein [Campylobacter blaseri]QKF85505.1 molybdenum ABC transporter ModABC, ATP-binding protein [Campylobacter blaseri]